MKTKDENNLDLDCEHQPKEGKTSETSDDLNENQPSCEQNDQAKEDEHNSDDVKDALESLNGEISLLKDKELRIMAEFDNFKKRSLKQRDEIYKNAVSDSVCAFLEVLDNLERALEASSKAGDGLKDGLELILDQFKKALKSLGVLEIESKDVEFDPSRHEAVSTIVDESLGKNIICEVYRKGYILDNDKVLRHAMVCVANT